MHTSIVPNQNKQSVPKFFLDLKIFVWNNRDIYNPLHYYNYMGNGHAQLSLAQELIKLTYVHNINVTV